MNPVRSPFDCPQSCQSQEGGEANRAAPEDIGRRAPADLDGGRAGSDRNNGQAILPAGNRILLSAIDGDAPRRIAAQSKNDKSIMIAVDLEQLVLVLPHLSGVGVIAGALLGVPDGRCVRVPFAQILRWIGNQAAIGKPGCDERVVASDGGIFVRTVDAGFGMENRELITYRVFVVAGLEKDPVRDTGRDEQDCGPAEEGPYASAAAPERRCCSEEDRQWQVQHHKPSPWKLEKLQLRQPPDQRGDWELEQ